MRSLLSVLLLALFLISGAQQSVIESDPNDSYLLAIEYFEDGQFLHSKAQFEDVLNTQNSENLKRKSHYYLSLIELRLNQDPGPLEEFSELEKGTLQSYQAKMELGAYYFNNESYPECISLYQSIPQGVLNNRKYSEKQYRLGYSYFALKNWENALPIFKEVILLGENDKYKASYYAGFIEFKDSNSEPALQYLFKAEEDPDLVNLTAPIITQIYFEKNQYSEVIDYTSRRMENVGREQEVQLMLFRGEAYFAMEDFENASLSFQRSLDLSRSKRDPETYYKLAYAYDQLSYSDKAIDNYKISALERSDLGQLSAFRLGVLYLNRSDYSLSVNAFEEASKLDFDQSISEQSMFLAGKTEFSANRYEESIFTLRNFLDQFPESDWRNEASDILVRAYLNSSDYESAINYIEESGLESEIARNTYQSVTFFKGQQLFNEGQFEESLIFLMKSLRYQADVETSWKTNLLIAEAFSLLSQSDKAKFYYEKVIDSKASTELKVQSMYGLGFVNYNKGDFITAYSQFEDLRKIMDPDDDRYGEINVRMADCLFVQKEFQKAADLYRSVIDDDFGAYCNYQIGLGYYLMEESMEAESFLRVTIDKFPNSEYADNALYQLGRLKFELLQIEESKSIFDQLVKDYSNSGLIPSALLNRGLCSSNLGDFIAAEMDFRSILDTYPGHSTSNDALLGLQDLMSKGHEVDRFDEVLEQVKLSDPNNKGLFVIELDYAKSMYFDQRFSSAVSKLAELLSQDPNSDYSTEIKYYIGDSYNQHGKKDSALLWFDQLIGIGDHPFLLRVLDKKGKILMELQRNDDAIENYTSLLSAGIGNPRTTYKARDGLMRGYFQNSQFQNAVDVANEILKEENWKPFNAVENTWLIRGKSYLSLDNLQQAKDDFIQVVNASSGEIAAESLYNIALIQYKESRYPDSRETLFRLIGDFGSYKKWTGKSYLLIADNYIAEGELFQAKATLNSIIDRSQDSDLIREAEQRLTEVEKKEEELLLQESQGSATQKDSIE